MVEIVFSESAYGSLVVGQHYGAGKCPGGVTAVFLREEDDSQPTAEELRKAQEQAEERLRREWENAVPLGSRREDIFCFDLALSVGEITETEIGPQRRSALEKLLSTYSAEAAVRHLDEKLEKAQKALASVLERSAGGEPIRIWYSHNPDEMCGMCWLMARLRPLKQRGPVYLVKLPEWEYRDDNVICTHNSWGDISPGEWGRYQKLQQEAKPVFFASCAGIWNQLTAENAPLRICLNGKLHSAPEDIYDSFILRELDKQPAVFPEAFVIGDVLGKYQLGIGDTWVALRIEQMIAEGKLEVVEPAPEGESPYRKKLRKVRAGTAA